MIFVTIGSMFPFDRMIRAMDAWAGAEGEGEEILAQARKLARNDVMQAAVARLARVRDLVDEAKSHLSSADFLPEAHKVLLAMADFFVERLG